MEIKRDGIQEALKGALILYENKSLQKNVRELEGQGPDVAKILQEIIAIKDLGFDPVKILEDALTGTTKPTGSDDKGRSPVNVQ